MENRSKLMQNQCNTNESSCKINEHISTPMKTNATPMQTRWTPMHQRVRYALCCFSNRRLREHLSTGICIILVGLVGHYLWNLWLSYKWCIGRRQSVELYRMTWIYDSQTSDSFAVGSLWSCAALLSQLHSQTSDSFAVGSLWSCAALLSQIHSWPSPLLSSAASYVQSWVVAWWQEQKQDLQCIAGVRQSCSVWHMRSYSTWFHLVAAPPNVFTYCLNAFPRAPVAE